MEAINKQLLDTLSGLILIGETVEKFKKAEPKRFLNAVGYEVIKK